MCGIFGAISQQIHNPGEFNHFMNLLMEGSQIRGRDATGFASVVNDNRFVTDKHPVSAQRFARLNRQWRKLMDARSISMIGHTRAATAGSPSKNYNNHPFHGPRYSIAHNGGIWQHEQFAKEQGFKLATECDSEVILHFLEKHDHMADGIVDALAEMDNMAMMAVCALERDTGQVHLFRNNDSPCSVFKFPRWNATVFASTPHIIARAAANVLGTMGNVWQEAEMVFNSDKHGDIPAYSHVVIYPDGHVDVTDLDDAITEQAGHVYRGRRWSYSGYSLDIDVFSGGTSKYESGGDSANSRVLENTAVMTTCPDCRNPVMEPGVNDIVICECGCQITSGGSSSGQKDTADPLEDVYRILPNKARDLAAENILEYLDAIRSVDEGGDRYNLTEYSVNEYICFDMKSPPEKMEKWKVITRVSDLLDMGDGEYLAYYCFVEEMLEARARLIDVIAGKISLDI